MTRTSAYPSKILNVKESKADSTSFHQNSDTLGKEHSMCANRKKYHLAPETRWAYKTVAMGNKLNLI